MILNPTKILWDDTTQNIDDSPFDASQFQAYELGVGEPPVPVLALPVAYGVGESPIPDAIKSTSGASKIALRTLNKWGQFSDWTPSIEVVFSARPLAPANFSAL